MDLRLLMVILLYYILVGGAILTAGDTFTDDDNFNGTIVFNDSDIQPDEIDTGGVFTTGVSIGRFTSLLTFGVGLPANTPSMVKVFFALWQSAFTLFTLGFIVSSIWDG